MFILLSSLNVLADSVIKEFSGSGNLTTRPFKVPNGWELQWEAVGEGAMFSVWLRAENGKRLDLLANNMCPTSGSSYQPKGGSYYLEFIANSSWLVKVVKVE